MVQGAKTSTVPEVRLCFRAKDRTPADNGITGFDRSDGSPLGRPRRCNPTASRTPYACYQALGGLRPSSRGDSSPPPLCTLVNGFHGHATMPCPVFPQVRALLRQQS